MELGRRERQIMAFIYGRGQATASEVQEGITDPPGYSGVRAMLRILEEKGYLGHVQDGPRYVYRPTHSPEEARQSAMSYLVQAFFSGSAEHAIAALLDQKRDELSGEELDRLSRMIEQAKQEGT
jgi:predicted transcriptional regulator